MAGLWRARQRCSNFWNAMCRTKTLNVEHLQETELKRCLSLFDLIALGVGSTLGAGVYILTGQVARNQAGPAVVLSFLIAAVTSFLAGICYAELAARVPRAGSAYIYSYISVGECLAFVIGWNMILENMIGAAAVGKAWSEYFDAAINDTIRLSIEEHVGRFDSPWLGTHPDFLACAILLLATFLVSMGVKLSSLVNCVLTILNVLVIFCAIVVGLFYADGRNWTNPDCTPSGFFPYGFRGVLSGAATCFYAFVGFDTIATSGEEARKPTQNIPNAIVVTLVVCFLAYFGVSAVLTLMVPWCTLAQEATLPNVFAQTGVYGAEYVITVGGLCGLTAAMMGCIFPLPRTVYAMAQDGLLLRPLGTISALTDTPMWATWLTGLLAAILALVIDLNSLVQMMSIGTLMAYTLVAISVLVLRYQRENIGLTTTDVHLDLDLGHENTHVTDGPPTTALHHQPGSVDEDTGLLRVGDQVNLVSYVPSKETTVFKRVPTEDDETDSKADEEPSGGSTVVNADPSNHSKARGRHNAGAMGKPDPRPRHEMVEEVRSRRDQEILARMANYMSEPKSPPGSTYQRVGSNYSLSSIAQLFRFGDDNGVEPSEDSRRTAVVATVLIVVSWSGLCVLSVYGDVYIDQAAWWAILLLCVFCAVVIASFIVLVRQPLNHTRLNFRVPFVPLIPTASVMINIYLMMTLSSATWVRFGIWMALGFIMYFGYGVWHSSERRSEDQEVILYDISDQDSILVDGVYR